MPDPSGVLVARHLDLQAEQIRRSAGGGGLPLGGLIGDFVEQFDFWDYPVAIAGGSAVGAAVGSPTVVGAFPGWLGGALGGAASALAEDVALAVVDALSEDGSEQEEKNLQAVELSFLISSISKAVTSPIRVVIREQRRLAQEGIGGIRVFAMIQAELADALAGIFRTDWTARPKSGPQSDSTDQIPDLSMDEIWDSHNEMEAKLEEIEAKLERWRQTDRELSMDRIWDSHNEMEAKLEEIEARLERWRQTDRELSMDQIWDIHGQYEYRAPEPRFDPAVSLVDYINLRAGNASFAARATLAAQYGIPDYEGTADQNSLLLRLLTSGAAPQPTDSASPDSVTITPPKPTITVSGDFVLTTRGDTVLSIDPTVEAVENLRLGDSITITQPKGAATTFTNYGYNGAALAGVSATDLASVPDFVKASHTNATAVLAREAELDAFIASGNYSRELIEYMYRQIYQGL